MHSSIQDVEVGGSEVQAHPWLHNEFEASLSYMRFCFKEHMEEGGSLFHIFIF